MDWQRVMAWVDERIEAAFRRRGLSSSGVPGSIIIGPTPPSSTADHNHTAGSGDGGKLSGAVVDTYQEYEEQGSPPSTPASNKGRLFGQDSGGQTMPYWRSQSGDIIPLGGTGGTGAATIYTSPYDTPPSSPAAGDLWLPSDGLVALRYTGAAWVPWGPLFPLAGVADRPTTWVNQGTSTETVRNGGAFLAASGSTYNERRRVKTPPATPYTITACILPNIVNHSGGQFVSLCWALASSGASVNVGLNGQGQIQVWKNTNVTTFDSFYVSPIGRTGAGPLWLRIGDDGTNRTCEYSADGQFWLLLHTVSRTNFITADQVGWAVLNASTANPIGATLLSWKETP